MTNTMPVLTEEDRQALISDCKEEIEKLERWKKQWDKQGVHSLKYIESQLKRQQIALASLEAEQNIELYRTRLGQTVICRKPEVDIDSYAIGYTPPPVPALKLPDEIDWRSAFGLLSINHCGEDRIEAFCMGANWRLAEVKKLNGVTE